MFGRKKITKITKLYFCYSTGNHKDGFVSYTLDIPSSKLIYKPDGTPEEKAKEYNIDQTILVELEDKLNELNVGKWDRFHKNRKRVKDGNSFTLSIIYKKDKQIYAHGYAAKPKNYNEVQEYLDYLFNQYIK